MKKQSSPQVLALVWLLSFTEVQASLLGPVARDAQGRVVRMTHMEAASHCRRQGSRLPSIRELALAYNPGGIHLTESSPGRFVSIQSADYRVDFYYDVEAYQRGSGDEAMNWFWSATLPPGSPDHAYVFDALLGRIFDYNRAISGSSAVRCFMMGER
jgi:hypothetical protein